MKRPRSYGSDLDDAAGAGEKRAMFKDWDRPSSALRRFGSHSRSESFSRRDHRPPLEDDRDPVRASRKHQRPDYEPEGSSERRRSGGFGYGWDGPSPSGSSYGGGGGERIRRAESFSAGPRREFPKGFRSERDRGRSGGSSWRRAGGGDVGKRSPSVESGARGRDRGSMRSKETTSSREDSMSRSVEMGKAAAEEDEEEVRRKSSSSAEMEEGELKPEAEPVSVSELPVGFQSQENERKTGPQVSNEAADKLLSEKDANFDGNRDCDGEKEGEGVQNDSPKELSDGIRVDVDADQDRGKVLIQVEEQLCSDMLDDEKNEVVVEKGEDIPASLSCPSEAKLDEGEERVEAEFIRKEEERTDVVVEKKDGNGIDVEAGMEGSILFVDSSKKINVETNREEVTLKLMTDKPVYDYKQKGKSPAIVGLANSVDSMGEEDAMEGPSGRGFDLVFCSSIRRRQEKATGSGGVVIGKVKEEEQLKSESLDLSLSLPNLLLDQTSKQRYPSRPNSPGRGMSIQSLPSSSFRTNSDGFTVSMSFSGSQTFTHNPSCSLMQNSHENFENSVGSRPLFQGIDQSSNFTVWRGQSLNENRRKGGAGLLIHRAVNGNGTSTSHQAVNGQNLLKYNGILQQSSLSRQPSPANSHGSDDTRSEHSRDTRRQPTTDRNSSGLFKSELQEAGEFAVSGVGFVEKIVFQIVGEPVHVIGRMVQSMTENSVAYMKEVLCEMVANKDKQGQLHALQEALQRRSDLTVESLHNCNRTVLEILVALKTGLPDLLRRTKNVSSPDLVDIFLNLKCRNLACQSILPVDDCDCKVCAQKNGFCSACMCLVCFKFDMASNTCSWVGCDVCLHWCHTDCGLRESHIRNGLNMSKTQGMTEMQFHCVACNHPSEMLGFVKEVFITCAKDWNAENLGKELHYVRRIFSASSDARGKKLHDVAGQMLVKLEEKADIAQVISYVMSVLTETESNNGSSSNLLSKDLPRNNANRSNDIASSSKETKWFAPISLDKDPQMENNAIPSSIGCDRMGRHTRDADLQINLGLEKKPVVDELESVVKFKQAEAKMYQERANDARKEAEGLKRIAIAKNAKIEEDYTSRITKLQLNEADKRRKQKIEELQALERVHREYLNIKMRMEAGIKDLLLKLEATKRNFDI